MKNFENHPRRCRADMKDLVVVDPEPSKSPSRRGRKRLRGFIFLLVLLLTLGGIVWHYSRFSSHCNFVLKTEESALLVVNEGKYEFQRLLVRNRFPFVLMVSACLCRLEDDEVLPRFTSLDTRDFSFAGTRSWYSGTYEARVTFVTSDDGRFTITDLTGKPWELLEIPPPDSDTTERNVVAGLPASLSRDLREGKLSGISDEKDIKIRSGRMVWYYSIPGDHADKVLVITLKAVANYE